MAHQWADHHNAVTAYMVAGLLAATGGRPVNSPFERLAYFDLDTGVLYVADKFSSRLHQGRLVPLPLSVVNLIRGYYLPHLRRLSLLVSQIDPRFSEALKTIGDGGLSDDLPLFFLLTSKPKLRWLEVSETSLSALGIFSWPLPWNLMRHRLPTALKRMGADHECVNGITGHGESGTAAYGVYSMRIWNEDATSLRPALGELLSSLQLRTPETPAGPGTPIAKQTPDDSSSCLKQTREFGSLAREKQRRDQHILARENAETEIVAFVAGRPIDSLSAQDWETLSQMMLLHKDHRPRTHGSIRYDTLQQWITRHWREKGLRPRIKRRYLPALEEKSPFTAQAIGCIQQVQSALDISSQVVAAQVPSRTSLRESLALGITLLVLESRLADTTVVDDLIQNRNYRLVIFQRDYFLEHSPGLDKVPDAPCRRFTIGLGVFRLLARALQATVKLDLRNWPLKESLRKIANPIPALAQSEKLGSYLHTMCGVVQQTNNLQFPGVVAAYLNGEIVTAALRHVDWARITLGKALDFSSNNQSPPVEVEAQSVADDDYAPPPETIDAAFVYSANLVALSGMAAANSTVKMLQDGCFSFFRETRDALNEELLKTSPDRDNLDSKLRALGRQYSGQVSRSCLLLAEWQRSLLWRKSPGYLTLRSILRYFNALSVCFQAMAYAHDLTSCEEEEVTEFYRQVMEIRRLVRPHRSSKPVAALDDMDLDDDDDIIENEKRSATWYRSQQLALQLLRDFHRLVHREFAVEDPDWSEIGAAEGLLSISPGTLTESEYLCSLLVLSPEPHLSSREQLAKAFILLVAFRFGLRGAEITGTLRSDWVDDQVDALVVLVRGNIWRRLKTPAGQRQVPLLFLLTDHEKEVISRWLDSWEGLTAATRRSPLFAVAQPSEKLMDSLQLRREVSEVIKQATGNPGLSLHHARHAFANNAALLLIDNTEGLWPFALSAEQTTPERKSHVRRLLLVTDGVTRRTLWALARLLGHVHPQTGVRSYLHLLPELAARYVNLPPAALLSTVDVQDRCVNLNALADLAGYLEPASADYLTIAPPALTVERALHFLQMRQRGIGPKRAGSIVGITESAADLLHGVMKVLDEVLAKRPHVNLGKSGELNFLSHIPQSRWSALKIKASSVKWSSGKTRSEAMLIQSIAQMIGPTRQVVLWKSEHFHFFGQVVQAWQLSDASYRFICNYRSKDALLLSAAKAALSSPIMSKLQRELSVRSAQQIDQIESGDLAMLVKHRCAVTTETDTNSDLRSSYELVLIVTVSLVAHIEAKQLMP